MHHTNDDQLNTWLTHRCLSPQVAMERGVRLNGNNIEFPYLNLEQDEVYCKVRTPDKRMWCAPSGIDQVLCWGESLLPDPLQAPMGLDQVLVIVEGEPDVLAIDMLKPSYPHVISVPSGAGQTFDACRQKALRCLSVGGKVKPAIAQFKMVIVATDCDSDGLLLRDAITEIIGTEYCLHVTYPHGCKDANDVLIERGSDALKTMLDDAHPVFDDGIIGAMDIKREPLVPLSLGVDWLSNIVTFVEPELVVIGGEANVGKSTAGYWLLYNFIANNPDHRCTIFNGEDPTDIIIHNMLTFFNRRARTEGQNTADRDWQAKRNRSLNERFAFVVPHQDENVDLAWVLNRMERSALIHKRRVFWIDPWNEITLKKTPGQSNTDAIGDALVAIKRLARRHKMIVIISHHTTIRRDAYGDAPNKYALADSAHWANKSDHMLIVHQPRPKNDPELRQLISARVRVRGVMGEPTSVYFRFNAPNFDLYQTEPREEESDDDAF